MSRLHAKTNQIGKLLNNLEKYNHFLKDVEDARSPTTPNGSRSIAPGKSYPLSPCEENAQTGDKKEIKENEQSQTISTETKDT